MKDKTEPLIGIRSIKDDPGKPEKEDISKKALWRVAIPFGLDSEDLAAIRLFIVYMLLIIIFASTIGLALRVFLWSSGFHPEW